MDHATLPGTAGFSSFPLLQILAAALARIANSYDEFSNRDAPDSPKDFIAHHNACKAALAHIGALIKLHQLWQKNSQHKPAAEKNEDLETLMRQARAVLLATDNLTDHLNDIGY